MTTTTTTDTARSLICGVLRWINQTARADFAGYHGTGGWHITAYATPDLCLGFVNIAHGVAVSTDVALAPEIVEALTVPGQAPGAHMSGAAAWTAPDVGIAGRPGAPEGWIQLAVDLRGSAQPVQCRARIVMWGLRTCYGKPGRPGAMHLDRCAESDPRVWPVSAMARERMHTDGRRILDRVARQLTAIAGDNEAQGPGHGHSAAWSVVMHGDAASRALDDANITRLCMLAGDMDRSRVVGARTYDALTALVGRILVRDLTPVAEALWENAAPHVKRAGAADDWHLQMRVVGPLLEQILPLYAAAVLHGLVHEGDEEAVHRALMADGPIEVSVPLVRSTE